MLYVGVAACCHTDVQHIKTQFLPNFNINVTLASL